MTKSNKQNQANLHAARAAKNDEFYTQLIDIVNELKHYKSQFADRIVYCNCDNPEWSNFFKYFYTQFNVLNLKKLITTHFAECQSYKLEVTNDDGQLVETKTTLEGNGDFRSPECVEILKSVDIVVSNPPFSLFREYVEHIIEQNKQFLIVGNNNAITYKEIFKLIKSDKLWLGHSANKTFEFELPQHYEKWNRIDPITNKKYGNVPAISWFTNMLHYKRNEGLILVDSYKGNESKYPKYDNYDAIEVSKTKDIPVDYFGAMGVPITFLDKFNSDQFEIIGLASSSTYADEVVGLPFLGEKDARPSINGKNTYARLFIKRKV